MKSRQGYKGYVIEARSHELSDGKAGQVLARPSHGATRPRSDGTIYAPAAPARSTSGAAAGARVNWISAAQRILEYATAAVALDSAERKGREGRETHRLPY
jgi:hypothetical protein